MTAVFFFINQKKELIIPNKSILTKGTFYDLPGWEDVEIFTAKKAFKESCKKILKKTL